MDQREFHLQHVGICYKLYHFIMRTLAAQTLKTVTLGAPSHFGSSSIRVPISDATQRGPGGAREDKTMRPETPFEGENDKEILTEHTEEKFNSCIDESELKGENMGASLILPQAPKKMVSINDNVEEIILPSKNKSFQKSISQDQEDQHLKPLRSILKVGSNLNDKSNPAC